MNDADRRAQLEAILARWRHSGASEDAGVLEREALAAVAARQPPAFDSERAFHRAWLQAVDDPIGRCWAIDTVADRIPGEDDTQRASALAKRIEALARHRPDPRFERVASTVWRSGLAHSSMRLIGALQRLEAAAAVAPSTALRVVKELPAATPEIEALWREVHADPDDDGALTVLADALQGIGDPRGEVIALQLSTGEIDEAARATRLRQLIAACGAAWLGPLARAVRAASFERGVLRRLDVSDPRPGAAPAADPPLDSPALATVTDLVSNRAAGEVYARLVRSPALRSLARMDVFDRSSLRALPHAPPSLRHVACAIADAAELSVVRDELVRALSNRPGVTSLAIHESDVDRFAALPLFGQLTALTLGVGGNLRRGLARWAGLPGSMTLTVVPDTPLPSCATSFPWDFGVTLSRVAGATVAQVRGDWLLLPLEALTALPSDVERVEVDHPSASMADRLRGALARRAIQVVHRPTPRLAAVYVAP